MWWIIVGLATRLVLAPGRRWRSAQLRQAARPRLNSSRTTRPPPAWPLLLQATATVVGVFLSLLAVVFYLALAIFYVIDPIRLMRHRSRPPGSGEN